MPRDYRETVRALRAKAADKAVTPEERELLNAKADEIEKKHGVSNGGTFAFHIHIPTDGEMAEQLRKEYYNRMYHDDYNGGVEDQEMPPQSPPNARGYGWSPDKGKYRRQWNPWPDDQDLISPEYRYDWSDE